MSTYNENTGRGSGGRGRGSNRGRGYGGGGHGRQRFTRRPTKDLDSNKNVPMLTFGTNTNYGTFKEKLTISCVEKYGNLARFLNDGKYYEPDELNPDDFVTAVDAMKEIKRQEMLVEVKERRTAINKMKRERPNMYAYIFLKLSPESEQEVKRHKDYNTFTKSLDPLALWEAI